MFYEVIPAKGGVREVLTYSFDSDSLLPGQIVEVPLMRGMVPGIVVKKVAQPDFKCKAINKILYSKPLPKHLLDAMRFIAEYYACPIGAVGAMVLPNGILKKRRNSGVLPAAVLPHVAKAPWGTPSTAVTPSTTTPPKTEHFFNMPVIPLNGAQKKAILGLQEAQEATKLLFGVTGSGKTNVYLHEAARALKEQKSVVLLVPEIALTGQLVRVFGEYFGDKIVLIHSKQTEAERHRIFEYILNHEGPLVVVGPRSALFAPLENLGLIIIDEEHESSYYQENPPRYSAVRVASFMAKKLGVSCLLGSATPLAEDYFIAKKCNSLITLKEKAKAKAVKPEISIVDFKNRDNFSKNRYFSNQLLMTIKDNILAGRQTLIFHNRRGSAPLTICEKCGEEMLCPSCFLPLTLHTDSFELVCHTCGYKTKVPPCCPKCGEPELVHKGFGTKLLESELKRIFPSANVMRFDADSKKGESLEAVYDEVVKGKVDVLVGTQMLAKGLDLPKLATVGVVQADAGLSLPDFAAEERVFQLLTQVIGRVGRGHSDKAEVIIQTFRPEHPVLSFAMNEDYEGFFDYVVKRRVVGKFPPFYYIGVVSVTAKTEATTVRKIREAARNMGLDVIVSTPMPVFHERSVSGYSWQVIVRAKNRGVLAKALGKLGPDFKITLDPPSLL